MVTQLSSGNEAHFDCLFTCCGLPYFILNTLFRSLTMFTEEYKLVHFVHMWDVYMLYLFSVLTCML